METYFNLPDKCPNCGKKNSFEKVGYDNNNVNMVVYECKHCDHRILVKEGY